MSSDKCLIFTRTMKIFTLLTFLCLLMFSCKKETSIIDDYKGDEDSVLADFFLEADSIYVHQKIYFKAADTTYGQNYSWDFGDNTTVTKGYRSEHSYSKEGVYPVTLSIHGNATSKQLYVYPGAISYQVKNESIHDLTLQSYVSNPDDFGWSKIVVEAGKISDTIYSNSMFIRGASNIVAIQMYRDSKLYGKIPVDKIKSAQHNIITLNNSSNFTRLIYNLSEVKDTITLGDW